MPIHLRCEQKKANFNLRVITRSLQKCLRRLNFPQAEISVLITNDKTIRSLNRQYRGVDQATDILSFGMREQRHGNEPLPPHPQVLGDLVVSLPFVARQAQVQGVPLQTEMHFILIHGLLHLLGYDHTTRSQELRMSALHRALAREK
jgi:probable rRNA maturation factor